MTATQEYAAAATDILSPPDGKSVRLWPKRKERTHGGGPPPIERIEGHGPLRCDKCHVAEAQYEVTISDALRQFLYLCAHHMRKLWADMVAKGYEIRKL